MVSSDEKSYYQMRKVIIRWEELSSDTKGYHQIGRDIIR
jgi:hypothetical protein